MQARDFGSTPESSRRALLAVLGLSFGTFAQPSYAEDDTEVVSAPTPAPEASEEAPEPAPTPAPAPPPPPADPKKEAREFFDGLKLRLESLEKEFAADPEMDMSKLNANKEALAVYAAAKKLEEDPDDIENMRDALLYSAGARVANGLSEIENEAAFKKNKEKRGKTQKKRVASALRRTIDYVNKLAVYY